ADLVLRGGGRRSHRPPTSPLRRPRLYRPVRVAGADARDVDGRSAPSPTLSAIGHPAARIAAMDPPLIARLGPADHRFGHYPLGDLVAVPSRLSDGRLVRGLMEG